MSKQPILHVNAQGPALDRAAAAVKAGNAFTKSEATDADIIDTLEIFRLPTTAANVAAIREKLRS